MMRIGLGTDVHRLVGGRPLVLGGVTVDTQRGAEGHSDADALMHAATDAIFGALAEGDIGSHFPNTEDRWKNAESSVFLRYAVGLMKDRGFAVSNFDSVIDLEMIRLQPFISQMRSNVAAIMEIEPGRISIKAKSGERVDAVGSGDAVRASVVVLLERG